MKKFLRKSDFIDFWYKGDDGDQVTVSEKVSEIIKTVRKDGDDALRRFTRQFDRVEIDELKVSPDIIVKCREELDPEFADIYLEAAENIRKYHQKQFPISWFEENKNGVKLGQKFSPVDSAGLYVPGGRAVYPSTLLMNVIPARIAGVIRIVIVTPPGNRGIVDPVIAGCAGLLEVDELYTIGGAQVIAALAYGTESVKPVSIITGPGNKFVNEAKKQVFGKVGIDMPAGPSELIILADELSNIKFITSDIFAQAEHDPDAKTALITTSENIADNVFAEIKDKMIEESRNEIIRESIINNFSVFISGSMKSCIEAVNETAPEHLQLMVSEPDKLLDKIINAGAIFLGDYSPTAIGDYWAGPNHTLPTAGAAKYSSPLNVMDFMKFSSLISYPEEEICSIGRKAAQFATFEKLYSHSKSIEVRYE